MIVELGLLFTGVAGAWLAIDNLKLRRRLRRLIGPVEPVNVLSNGIVLPEADDPRWTKVMVRRRLVQTLQIEGIFTPPGYTDGPEEAAVQLNDVVVLLHDRMLLIEGSNSVTKTDPKAKPYAEAVVVAYFSKRSLVSIQGGPDAGQV